MCNKLIGVEYSTHFILLFYTGYQMLYIIVCLNQSQINTTLDPIYDIYTVLHILITVEMFLSLGNLGLRMHRSTSSFL